MAAVAGSSLGEGLDTPFIERDTRGVVTARLSVCVGGQAAMQACDAGLNRKVVGGLAT